jgi:hypothetical protein
VLSLTNLYIGLKAAVEINANPWRLDLDWRWHRLTLKLGCMISINPDAHSTSEIDLTHWGIEMGRKGGVPKEWVLNCLALPKLEQFFASRHSGDEVRCGARPKRVPTAALQP